MKIEIFADIVCPWCFVGRRRLDEALTYFDHSDDVVISYRSFELDPGAQLYSGASIVELISKKYNVTLEEARGFNENLLNIGVELGIDFDFEKMSPTNSFDAHRLVQLAIKNGLGEEMVESLMKGYFEDGALISDHEQLASMASRAGMDFSRVSEVLGSDEFAIEVRRDESFAASIGVSGVPFYLIEDKYAISGAQDTMTFVSAMTAVWSKLK